MLERAKAVYAELSDLHCRSVFVSQATVRTYLSDFVRGRRKYLTGEMQTILADWAAWTGQLPQDETLKSLATDYANRWNLCGPYWGAFEFGSSPVSSIALAAHYLGSIGLGPGGNKRTLYEGLSTEALDAAACILRETCPEKWYVSSGEFGRQPARTPSKAERWLLEKMSEIDCRITAAVVRAVITRTSQ